MKIEKIKKITDRAYDLANKIDLALKNKGNAEETNQDAIEKQKEELKNCNRILDEFYVNDVFSAPGFEVYERLNKVLEAKGDYQLKAEVSYDGQDEDGNHMVTHSVYLYKGEEKLGKVFESSSYPSVKYEDKNGFWEKLQKPLSGKVDLFSDHILKSAGKFGRCTYELGNTFKISEEVQNVIFAPDIQDCLWQIIADRHPEIEDISNKTLNSLSQSVLGNSRKEKKQNKDGGKN